MHSRECISAAASALCMRPGIRGKGLSDDMSNMNDDDDDNLRKHISFAIKFHDLQTIRRFCHRKPTLVRARFFLYENLYPSFKPPSSWRFLVEHLIDLDVIDEPSLRYLNTMFLKADPKSLRILLNSQIDSHVREKFGVDLRLTVFGNRHVDAIELLRNRNVNVHSRSLGGWTALHWAAWSALPRNARFLLDEGIDVDCRDETGWTALFGFLSLEERLVDRSEYATATHRRAETLRLLLERGANAQNVDDDGLNVFQVSKTYADWDDVLARLALQRAEGATIVPKILDHLDENEYLRVDFEAYCRELETLRTREVEVGSLTLFDVLTGKVEALARSFDWDEDTAVDAMESYREEYQLYELYSSTLRYKVGRVTTMRSVKRLVAEIICESTGKCVDFDHLVVEKIFGYLSASDLAKFAARDRWDWRKARCSVQ